MSVRRRSAHAENSIRALGLARGKLLNVEKTPLVFSRDEHNFAVRGGLPGEKRNFGRETDVRILLIKNGLHTDQPQSQFRYGQEANEDNGSKNDFFPDR